MNDERDYFRPAYEWYAAAGWSGALLVSGWVVYHDVLPAAPFWYAAAFAVVRGTQRVGSAVRIWRYRSGLGGRSAAVVPSRLVRQKMKGKPDHVWVGWGFEWTRVHMQRLYDLEKRRLDRLRVPVWDWGRRRGPKKGNPLLHGVEPAEHDIYVPLQELAGHVFIPAATGAIKTRLLTLLAIQALHRRPNETVIVIDPKGDSSLRQLIRDEAAAAGRLEDFAYFHPALPRESVRIDPLFNWTRSTEVASRIGALIPSETGNDPFSAFGWRVLNLVVEGCVHTHNERPTLTTIRRYVEGGVDQLLRSTLAKTLEDKGVDWHTAIEPYLRNVKRYKRPSATTPDDTVALVAYYKSEWQEAGGTGLVDGLISMFEHDREHAQKMLASLIPVLTMLTAGDLADLLSPDRRDAEDPRPILDGAKIVESASIVYVGLDSLSDPVVGGAMASIFLADLTAHAGARFNANIVEPRINVFVDEANEAVNVPFIQLLNKGRSAGFNVAFFSQTVSDFEAKLGRPALARQVLGNANSIIAGRTKDKVTSEYVMESFGKTVLRHVQTHESTTPVADGKILNYAASFGERHNELLSDIVPAEALARLPDLEYFGTFSGSEIVKGRIPVIIPEHA